MKEIIMNESCTLRKKLFADFIRMKQEWNQYYWTQNLPGWDETRWGNYRKSVVLGRYKEHDDRMLQAMQMEVSDDSLNDEIFNFVKADLEKYQNIKQPNIIDSIIIEDDIEEIHELRSMPMNKFIEKNCKRIYGELETKEISEIRVFLYLYYGFKNFYRKSNHPCNNDLGRIDLIYGNFFDKQSQYRKYGLIPIDDIREILVINPPRLYDKSKNKTIFLKNIPLPLLNQIDILNQKNMIGSLAVRVSNNEIFDGKMNYEDLVKALERGKQFEFENLGAISIAKLYSTEYNDNLWISIDTTDITFEELYNKYHVYEDVIVTQVIHLQYEMSSGEAFITHLDHEYVFYTLEEYDVRQKNIGKKGEARQRMKSFKIDHTKIPFKSRCVIKKSNQQGELLESTSELFLYYVLECYFEHKDLLREYFEKVNSIL